MSAGAPENDQIFNNIIVVPQYALWFTIPEAPKKSRNMRRSMRILSVKSAMAKKSGDEVDFKLEEREDEPGLLYRQGRRVQSPSKMIIPTYVVDWSRILIHESLFTIPDESAFQLTPDFVVLHILAKELMRLPMLSSSVDMSAGQVIGFFTNAVRSSWRLNGFLAKTSAVQQGGPCSIS